ncbi:NACHT, LRR and PYD domains-containing protein 4 [Marmota marmota marmota]|uniref:NACHT, LRR and PYD domains-containing protein 4 n=1 Tax=Marmota marmota marmota TaxID=9994 RepID=UPI002093736C|nr:NACHT, LRR and PYD domains-containing protein 4 [Marmota marmota marmota]
MAASFIPDFRLMWYLDELKKNELVQFKQLLKQETVQRGLQPIPWAQVKKARRQDLASLMTQRYGEQPAWALALCIFPKIHRKDLCDQASRESAGWTNAYRAHIQKKLIGMWSRGAFTEIPGCFDQSLTCEEHARLEEYFTPRVPRRPRTVVLRALQRMGKTRFLLKVMLAWSDGTLYRDKFSFVFYFCCRELKQLRVTSLAGLMSRERPDDSVPWADVVAQPERILFIIDSLEELQCPLTEPESELCRDWREERSVKTVLSSLLRRKILPESALLLAAMPMRPEALESKLDHPNMQELKCFQDSHVKQYFCCSFEDRGRALAAFSLVRNNEHLFTMCHVPLLCWMVCTSLKQETERGRDLAATCCRSTSVFLSFVFQAFTPKGATRPSQQGQGLLKALCSLAAEGMWTDTWVFGEEELRRNGIADTDTPTLLDLRLLRKYSESGSSYSFIHMCMQEFCAAMYYLLDSPRDHPSRAVRPIEALLLTYFRKDRASWVFLGCFLFGLLHESEQQRLDALLGMQRSRELAPQLLGCLRILADIEDPEDQVEFLLLFYALFEVQSDAFASHLMSSLREAHFPLRERPDLAVAAYCLKYCSSLRELTVSVPEIFPEERGPDPMSSRTLLWWRQICSVLTANEHLQKLRVVDSVLGKWTLLILCCQLRQSTCPVQRLETRKVCFSCETGIFFEVFTSNPNLQHLSMTSTRLPHDEVLLLCRALSNPVCNLQELLLKDSGLSATDCKALASMLATNRKLTLLDLSDNKLAEGVSTLCAALRHPDCTLQTLVMAGCQICEHCCPHLSEVLLSNANLSHLDLSRNALMDEGVAQLCEALRQPTCSLQTLCLQRCGITMRICQDLALVLESSPNLRSLDVGGNNIGDVGLAFLSGGVLHPHCGLKELSLDSCQLTREGGKILASIVAFSKSLNELDLRGNPLDNSTIRLLCLATSLPGRVLRKLRVSRASTEEGFWFDLRQENPLPCEISMD